MRILFVRIAAFGDVVITTPVLRYLKQQGHEIYYLGSEQAQQVLENNPNVDKFIYHKRDSVHPEELGAYFEKLRVENGCDKIIDMCESVEVRLAVTPNYPQWNWSKKERKDYCNINYYEHAFTHSGYSWIPNHISYDLEAKKQLSYEEECQRFLNPEMFFTQTEEDFIASIREQLIGKRVIMWGLSGSGRQKTYAYVPYIVADLMKEFKDLVVMLVGGEACKVLECAFPKYHRILKKSGEFTFRQSALMAKYADLVVSPDTGFLHTSGCWDTPKIGLLTHTTIENITKHFVNDYSIESKSPCAPCFRLIQNAGVECPIEKESNSTLCMGKDYMQPEVIYDRIKEVLLKQEAACVS